MNTQAGKPDPALLTPLYEEVCRAHDGIATFRAHLLGLLPLASGAGIFLLLETETPGASPHLFAIGIFGMLVTLGLFLYELRGIEKCNELIACGKELEEVLGGSLLKDKIGKGAFNAKPQDVDQKRFGRIGVGATEAALVIYPAVIAAWGYVSGIGLLGLFQYVPSEAPLSVTWALPPFLTSSGMAAVVVDIAALVGLVTALSVGTLLFFLTYRLVPGYYKAASVLSDLERDAQAQPATTQIEQGEETIHRMLRSWQILSTEMDPAPIKALQQTVNRLQVELKNFNQLVE